jgi:ABC-type phosphate transport system substrate-binding protein
MKTFVTHHLRHRRARSAVQGLVLMLGLALAPATPGAGLVVIVNPDSGVTELTKAEVIHLFMGRQKRLPSGAAALTVDLGGTLPDKALFYAALVNKDLAEINSYWARLIFSGQGSPPLQAESAENVLEIVQNNRGAIGYVDADKVGPGVRVVFRLP